MSIELLIGYILLGLAGGVISGLLGLGSGTIFIPVLVLLFHLPQRTAQGTSLVVMIPMAMVAAWRYWGHPSVEINWRVVVLVVTGAVVGVFIGSALMGRIPARTLRLIFAIYLMIVSIRLLATAIRPESSPKPESRIVQTIETRYLEVISNEPDD